MNNYLKFFGLILIISCSVPQQEQGTLYELISPQETGVDFRNDLTFSKEFNIYTYRNYYNGGGVAVGDINNDGLLDIYFTGNSVRNRLYLNQGSLRFEDITASAGVAGERAWSTGVSMADINGDGLLDIYVCNSGDVKGDNKQNELYINNGDLTFTEKAEEYGLDDRGFSTHAAFFDYDKDGDLDAYLLNNSYQAIGSFNLMNNIRDERDSVGGDKLYENRDGKFVDISQEAGIYGSIIGFGLGVTVGDINNDNWQDIFVSNDFFERDYLYINNQDGTFTEVLEDRMRSISAASMGADMADINNDLQPDIFVTDMLPEPDARLKQVTTFESWDKYQYKLKTGYYHQFSRNMLHINNGDGSFTELGRYANVEATDWSWGALIFDMDNDGMKDLFVANGIYQDITDLDYLNFIADDETKKKIISKQGVDYKALVDPIPITPVMNYAFKNNGDLNFSNEAINWGLDQKTHSNGSAYADLDNDGDFELIISNVNDLAYIYKNNASENSDNANYLRVKLIGEGKNTNAFGAKVFVETDSTSLLQEQMPIRGFQSTVDNRLTFGLGSAAKINRMKIVWPDSSVSTFTDLTVNQEIIAKQKEAKGDEFGEDELTPAVESKVLFKSVGIEGLSDFEHSENTFVDFDRDRLTYHMRSNEGPAGAVADVNGDGLDDVFIGGAKGQSATLFIQQRDGKFLKSNNKGFENDKKAEDIDAKFFDADNDGDNDLFVTSGSSEFNYQNPALKNRLYINDGAGSFTKSVQAVFGLSEISSCVEVVDFDEDGDIDLFVGGRMVPFLYGAPAGSFLYENDGNGNFTDVTSEMAAGLNEIGMVTDAYFADIDGDKDKDLLVVGEWMQVEIFENVNSVFIRVTENSGSAGKFGWWNHINAADIDKDGDTDFIVGNHGTNSRFKPGLDEPLNLHVYDFDGNGTIEHIFSRYEDEKVLPYTLKHDLVMQIPSLKKEFLKFKNYKDKTIDQIFGAQKLEEALKLQANWFYTSVLINDGKGKFEVQPISGAAQYAPVYATQIVEDAGSIKILMGGNQYRAKPQVGIYEANHGIIYETDQNNTFNFLPFTESGFYLEGEARNILPVEIAGKQHLLVIRNNESPMIFENI